MAPTRVCIGCGSALVRKNQWLKKRDGQWASRCIECVASDASGRNALQDGTVDVDDGLDSLLAVENMRASIHERMVSSLGDGYDDGSLQLLDRKMCDCFLSEDSLCYDHGWNKRSANPQPPTAEEVERYKKSDIIRKAVLREASGIQAMSNYLGGQGRENLQLYQELYNDLRTYHYAWFEIIFKEDSGQLHMACSTMMKFASVKLEIGGDVDEMERVMEFVREVKDMFQDTVKPYDKEACEDAGILEYDFYELKYKLSIELAKAGKEVEAEMYFEDALLGENVYGYYDAHCTRLMEYATGRDLSYEDTGLDSAPYEGLYYKCLRAHIQGRGGSVPWKSHAMIIGGRWKKRKNVATIAERHRDCWKQKRERSSFGAPAARLHCTATKDANALTGRGTNMSVGGGNIKHNVNELIVAYCRAEKEYLFDLFIR